MTIRRVSDDKMYVYHSILYADTKRYDSACDETKEIVIELFEYRRKYLFLKEKVRILTAKVTLEDGKLYTKETYIGEWRLRRTKSNTDC